MRLVRKLAATAAIAVGSVIASAPVAAAEEASSTVTVIHGTPGADLGLAPELPVDVLVNGEPVCVLTGLNFGETTCNSPKAGRPEPPVGSGRALASARVSDCSDLGGA